MARKKKGRSVKKNQQTQSEPDELIQAPHTFVIHRGLPGGHITELTKDFRRVMEPFTAAQLRERKKNTIKDFVSIASIFHVSHMCIFTRTELGMYMKIGKLPRGPTLSFKVHNFSLSRDVISTLKKQFVISESFKHSPLMVLNNFSGEGMHIKLMASTFQNMFPTINLTNVNLNTMRRCVLLSYNPQTKLIDFRHYSIKVIPVGISKGVKKFIQGKVPNLAKCNEISDFLTKTALLSESEAEDDPNSQVTIPQLLASRGNLEGGQSAIRLTELGPRLSLQLMKVEDGLLDGEVLFHELLEKTEEEKKIIQKKRDEKRKLKENRKKQQNTNIENKEKKKEVLKNKSLEGMQKKGKTENDRLMQKAARESNAETNLQEDNDAEYYRQEVGEEPDHDLFSNTRKRTMPFDKDFKSKRPRMDNNSTEKSFDDKKKFARFDKTGKKFGNKTKSFDKTERNFGDKKKFDRFDKNKKPGNKFDRNNKPGNKFDKNKKSQRNANPNKKWPGGRGGNPKYGVRAQNSEDTEKKKGRR